MKKKQMPSREEELDIQEKLINWLVGFSMGMFLGQIVTLNSEIVGVLFHNDPNKHNLHMELNVKVLS